MQQCRKYGLLTWAVNCAETMFGWYRDSETNGVGVGVAPVLLGNDVMTAAPFEPQAVAASARAAAYMAIRPRIGNLLARRGGDWHSGMSRMSRRRTAWFIVLSSARAGGPAASWRTGGRS